jgi:hypothetical protein
MKAVVVTTVFTLWSLLMFVGYFIIGAFIDHQYWWAFGWMIAIAFAALPMVIWQYTDKDGFF